MAAHRPTVVLGPPVRGIITSLLPRPTHVALLRSDTFLGTANAQLADLPRLSIPVRVGRPRVVVDSGAERVRGPVCNRCRGPHE